MYNIWVYLSASPLLHLTLTLVAYQIGDIIARRCHYHPLVSPVLIAVVLLVVMLELTHTSYSQYFAGAQFVHFLLGPATVALAIPLYRAYEQIRTSAAAILVALISGSLFAAGSAVLIGYVCGGQMQILLSLAPKSVTTPIAMGVSEAIGGSASLTAIVVVLTGIFGAMISTIVLNLVRVTDKRARGFATGLAAHGVGTAYMLRINQVSGAFAGLAMALNGVATAILLPLLVHWLRP